jgi:hypothetical protein
MRKSFIKITFHKVLPILNFYVNGFKNMKIGKTLWKVIFIKLFLIFVILNYFIYDKSIDSEFLNDEEKAEYVYKNLKGN